MSKTMSAHCSGITPFTRVFLRQQQTPLVNYFMNLPLVWPLEGELKPRVAATPREQLLVKVPKKKVLPKI